MATSLGFAGLQAWLRSPRLAVVVPDNHWESHAHSALRFLSGIWGGAGGVILPLDNNGSLHPAVARLANRFDPDYVLGLMLRLSEAEALSPGSVSITDAEAQKVTDPHERERLIEEAEATTPQFVGLAVAEHHYRELVAQLPGFKDEDGYPRCEFAHADQKEPDSALARAPQIPEAEMQYESGDQLIDLAIAIRSGLAGKPSSTLSVAASTLSREEVVDIVTKNPAYKYRAPIEATMVGLAEIVSARQRMQKTTLVLGEGPNDFAVTLLLDRFAGTAIWLPVDTTEGDWHATVGVALKSARNRTFRREFLVTSTTLSEAECAERMEKFGVPATSGGSQVWTFVPATEVEVHGRTTLRLADKWDERFSMAVQTDDNGSSEMPTTFPLIAPENLPAQLSGWIVQAIWPQHPVHTHISLRTPDLFAADQDSHETFVRPSSQGIAFESSRWDFVPSGGSKYSQLAQPKLRWPGLIDTIARAADSSAHSVDRSHAGTIGRIVSDLWGSREALATDLSGNGRALLDRFVDERTGNGPLDTGPGFDSDNTRAQVNRRTIVPFGSLDQATSWDTDRVREWADRLMASGTMTTGLALFCEVCRWCDYYRLDAVGSAFICTRCGTSNILTRPRWKTPNTNPVWFYALHPPVTEFLRSNGDVPVLAVHQYGLSSRVFDAEFELEFTDNTTGRPAFEIDFAFTTAFGLVVGEAKRAGSLDGKNHKQKVADARKLVRAANMTGADEICFASASVWDVASKNAIAEAISTSDRLVTVSAIENLASLSLPSRTVLHNSAGP